MDKIWYRNPSPGVISHCGWDEKNE